MSFESDHYFRRQNAATDLGGLAVFVLLIACVIGGCAIVFDAATDGRYYSRIHPQTTTPGGVYHR